MPDDLDRHTAELDEAKLDDDDTSAGRITQGGRGGRRGKSIWWATALVLILAAALATWAVEHKNGPHNAPTEQNTTPISGATGAQG